MPMSTNTLHYRKVVLSNDRKSIVGFVGTADEVVSVEVLDISGHRIELTPSEVLESTLSFVPIDTVLALARPKMVVRAAAPPVERVVETPRVAVDDVKAPKKPLVVRPGWSSTLWHFNRTSNDAFEFNALSGAMVRVLWLMREDDVWLTKQEIAEYMGFDAIKGFNREYMAMAKTLQALGQHGIVLTSRQGAKGKSHRLQWHRISPRVLHVYPEGDSPDPSNSTKRPQVLALVGDKSLAKITLTVPMLRTMKGKFLAKDVAHRFGITEAHATRELNRMVDSAELSFVDVDTEFDPDHRSTRRWYIL